MTQHAQPTRPTRPPVNGATAPRPGGPPSPPPISTAVPPERSRPTPTTNIPHDVDAERAVLGALLLDPGCYAAPEVQQLTPPDFFEPRHQIIFAALLTIMAERGSRGVDLLVLCDALRSRNELDAVGGYAYVATLNEACPGSSAAPEYASILREKALLRRLHAIGDTMLREAAAECVDALEIARSCQRLIHEAVVGNGRHQTTSASVIMPATHDHLIEVRERRQRGETLGTPTGFGSLDSLLGGFEPGSLNILAARPSIGKTAFALTLLLNASERTGRSAVYWSLEMSNISLATRAACCRAGVSADQARKGSLIDWDMAKVRHATEELAVLPLAFNDSPSLSAPEFAAEARLWVARHPDTALLVIDGLWLMNHSRDKQMTQAQRVGETTRMLKTTALELGVPILLLHQLNRDPEKRATNKERAARKSSRPSLSDLRDSGAPEQDADVVMFLHRERVEVQAHAEAGAGTPGHSAPAYTEPVDTEVFVAKSRNGPIGVAQMQFHLDTQRFTEKPSAW